MIKKYGRLPCKISGIFQYWVYLSRLLITTARSCSNSRLWAPPVPTMHRRTKRVSCVHYQLIFFLLFFSSDVILCSKCGEKVIRKNLILDRGFKNDMRKLSITCSFCDWTGILKNYQVSFTFSLMLFYICFFKDHLDNTHPNPQCIYCEQYLPTVNELNRHQQYVCEKMPINCPFKQFGCEEIVCISIFIVSFYSIIIFL